MKYLKFSLIGLIAIGMTGWALLTPARVSAQGTSTALERGYRTGYSDGYNVGYRDVTDHAARDYQNKEEYRQGNRNYNEVWGTAEDYRDGYQQGFEAGYTDGYGRSQFNSSIPTGLARRGTVSSTAPSNAPDNTIQNIPDNATQNEPVNSAPTVSGPVSVPRNTILLVELESSLSTDATQRGDRFQARVLQPREFEGAIIEGRVTLVKRPGKVKGTAEMQLSFESIRMPDNRTSPFNADVVEVVDMGGRDDGGTVDSEGGVRGRSSTKDTVSKVGASAGIGAVIGAIVGGGKGAAVGAAIGGSMGTAGVLTSRGKDLRLPRGQQLKIRTATDTSIQ
jgi:hypothetical protein